MSDKGYLDYEGLKQIIKYIKPLISSAKIFQPRTIVIWSGTVDEIPEGWHLCDGEARTPDLRGKFIIGSGNGYNVGDKGALLTTDDTLPDISVDNDTVNILPPYYILAYIMKIRDTSDDYIESKDIPFVDDTNLLASDNIQDAIDETYSFISSESSTISTTIGPQKEITTDLVAIGSKIRPVTNIWYRQDGSGTPSLDNIRPIYGKKDISLSFNGQQFSQDFEEPVYVGSYDWASGTLTLLYRLFELYPRDMNRTEEYPGWQNIPGLEECIPTEKQYYLPNKEFDYAVNLMDGARVITHDDGTNLIYVSTSQGDGGMTQTQWKETHGDQVCQFLFPLLEPKTIQLTKHQFIADMEINKFVSNSDDITVTYYNDMRKYLEKVVSERKK